MSWERSPICVTVTSEGAICKMGSSLVSTQEQGLCFAETAACKAPSAQACPLWDSLP